MRSKVNKALALSNFPRISWVNDFLQHSFAYLYDNSNYN